MIDLEKAHELKDHISQIWLPLATLLKANDKHQQASDIYEKLIKLEPDEPNHLIGFGLLQTNSR